jgi:hypothetical protein
MDEVNNLRIRDNFYSSLIFLSVVISKAEDLLNGAKCILNQAQRILKHEVYLIKYIEYSIKHNVYLNNHSRYWIAQSLVNWADILLN